VLDRVLRDHAGVERRAARDDDDLVDVAQLLVGQPHLVEDQLPVPAETAQQGVGDRLRLLGDLLEHEVVVTALLGGGEIPVDVEGAPLAGLTGEVGDLVGVGPQHHDVVLAELDRLAGVLDERRDVGTEKHLAFADAQHQRGRAARGHQDVRVGRVTEDEGERALEAAEHGAARGDEVAAAAARLHLAPHQVGGHLRVGVGLQIDPGGLELRAQRGEVLDDAVVHDRDVARDVRVGVPVARATVGGPAGVADAGGTREPAPARRRELRLEVGELALLLLDPGGARAVEDGDTSRVVAAVLHPPQGLDDDREGGPVPDISDDSAHGR
jgi:hypothetical protein